MYLEGSEARIWRFGRAVLRVLLAERERWGDGTNIYSPQNPHWDSLTKAARCTVTLACPYWS